LVKVQGHTRHIADHLWMASSFAQRAAIDVRLLDALEPQCQRAVDELTRLQAAKSSSSSTVDSSDADVDRPTTSADAASSTASHSSDGNVDRPATTANIPPAAHGKITSNSKTQ